MQPTWGGWGGRFNSRKTKNPINLNGGGYGEDYYIYTKAHDTYAGYDIILEVTDTVAFVRSESRRDFRNSGTAETLGEFRYDTYCLADPNLGWAIGRGSSSSQ
jgi:hypothetical protein